MATKLYVGNLSFKTTSDDLREHFSQAGEVESASGIEDRETGRSPGFGFVEMATPEGAAATAAAVVAEAAAVVVATVAVATVAATAVAADATTANRAGKAKVKR